MRSSALNPATGLITLAGTPAAAGFSTLLVTVEDSAGKAGFGIDADTVNYIAGEIVKVHNYGAQTAVVVGGGNFIRGEMFSAQGGIGSVNAHDLKRDGDDYINDAYGKTPATIRVKVQGGVGQITLLQQD